jgi:hypothetical protein
MHSYHSALFPRGLHATEFFNITLLVTLLAGCTTVPMDHSPRPDALASGPSVLLRVCILRDVDVAEGDAQGILAAF